MTKTDQLIELYQGEAKTVIVGPIVDADDEPLAELAGSVAWAAAAYTGGALVIEKAPTINDPEDGYISFELEPEDTADLEPDDYHHQAMLTDNADNPSMLFVGTLRIKASIL